MKLIFHKCYTKRCFKIFLKLDSSFWAKTHLCEAFSIEVGFKIPFSSSACSTIHLKLEAISIIFSLQTWKAKSNLPCTNLFSWKIKCMLPLLQHHASPSFLMHAKFMIYFFLWTSWFGCDYLWIYQVLK